MTYPEPRYLGDGGEASARLRAADHEPDYVSPSGARIHYLATGASTDGLFGLYRFEMGPGRSGPGPHFHRTITESFYVLAGTVTVYDGRAWVPVEAGGFAHVPIGGVHGFRNESGQPASMLIHFAPGAPREAYFEGVAGVGSLGESEREEFYRLHDNVWVPEDR